MEIRTLRNFAAVVHAGNVTRAAATLVARLRAAP